MNNFNVIVEHVIREGNTLADFMTNYVFIFISTSIFHYFSEMPSAGRRLLNLDKSHTPNLNIRVTRINLD